jgi:4-amino-4-deoxy-L-arabinose transferase-like glycosyltransferase
VILEVRANVRRLLEMAAGQNPELEPVSVTGPDRFLRATWAFVWLGVLLRVVTFALNFPLWGDEAFVAANLITRGYRDLLRPLDYFQICPLLFLWLELTAVKVFGFSEWSLRLIPSLCSVASVFLFAHVAGRATRGPARLLAVAIFSVAYYPIRHGAEVKPYSTDLLAALSLLALAIEWLKSPGTNRWLWALAATVPLALGLSHPAVFMAGGISLGLAANIWNARRNGALLPFAVYNLAMVASFVALFAVFTGEQERLFLSKLRSNYWIDAFPPLGEPVKLFYWLAEAHTGRMFAYPFGEARGGSSFTTLCFLAALFVLWRRGEKALILLALGPFGLALVASAMGRYPYGGSARTMIFAAPTICLYAGLGLAAMIARLRFAPSRRWAFRASVLGLTVTGVAMLGVRLLYPYKSIPDVNSRAFARIFWAEKARGAELVCVKSDLGLGFDQRNWTFFRSALYLCNQKIYSPRHHSGDAANYASVSADRPLRCVLYNEWPENNFACAAWLAQMTERFRVTNRDTFVVNESAHRDDGTDIEDRYTIYEFVPRHVNPSSRIARGDSTHTSRYQ